MQLIATDDGVLGWNISNKFIWCSDLSEIYSVGWSQIEKFKLPYEKQDFEYEVNLALDHMARRQHNAGNFGIFGNFIYSMRQ